jgi:hypothetical protein
MSGGDSAPQSIVINMGGITVQDNASKDEVGRTMDHLAQKCRS